jgi:hypothetical protein
MFPYRVACGLLKSMLCGALCIRGLIGDPGYVFLTKDEPLKAVPALEIEARKQRGVCSVTDPGN